MRPQKNKLAPDTAAARLKNFGLNLVLACSWLFRRSVRRLKRVWQRKDG